MSKVDTSYLNNQNLKRIGVKVDFQEWQTVEFKKCMDDPVYFAETYIRIVNVDRGLVPFSLWPFQRNMIETYYKNRFVIAKMPRQVGKTSTVVAYILHQILFRQNISVAILANKGSMARDILGRLQLAYEYLPKWLQQGIIEWNKGSVVLENGSKVLAASTSSSSVRGGTYNILMLDEFAFVPNNQAEQFFTSVYPTISSGQSTQVIITSTPNGMNHFYRIWKDAEEKRSNYVTLSVHWSEVPGRTQAWMEETIKNTSQRQFDQEFNTEFLGSSNTLISGSKIRSMVFENPIATADGIDIYKSPEENHTYALMVDVSRGQGLDYSAFTVIDVSGIPYRMVCKYKNNEIPAMLFPTVIYDVARRYNDAFVLVEISDIGQQVSDILHHDLEYENIVKVVQKGRAGQMVTSGHGSKKPTFGVKTSTATKRIGCANLKTLIEQDKLIVTDADTIMEMTTFIAKKESFAADDGNHDDLVMCLVLFGWFANQRYFKEGLKDDLRKRLESEKLANLARAEEEMVPFGFVDNGINPVHDRAEEMFDAWLNGRKVATPLDSFEFDYKGDFFKTW
jgi:hypothetical protein